MTVTTRARTERLARMTDPALGRGEGRRPGHGHVPGHGHRGDVEAPVPSSVRDLLRRSDEELVAARLSQDPSDRFRHAHLSAIRAGAAVLQAGPPRGPRSRPRPVWELLPRVAPGLAGWAAWFADNAVLRAALEAGRADVVTEDRADAALAAAEAFGDAVRAWWSLTVEDGGVQGTLRAS